MDVNKDEIIEISAVKFINGKYDSDFTTLIKPKKDIPKQITEITGINNDMVANSPTIDIVLDEFLSFINNNVIIAHNIAFDLPFIKRVVKEQNKELNINFTCDTLLLSRSFLFTLEKFNLEYLSIFFNLDIKNSHRAKADATNTGKIFLKLIDQMLSIPLIVYEKINSIYAKNSDLYNKYLYMNIYDYLKKNNSEKFSPIETLNLKTNIIDNTSGTMIDYSGSIKSWFDVDGKLSNGWEDYDRRDIQEEFAHDIYNNYKNKATLLAEAGAGLGKSLSYLVSGLKYAKEQNKKLIISTFTKTLQEQLFFKDLPVIANGLDLNLKSVILKGKNNYISKNMLNVLFDNNHIILSDTEIYECTTLAVWSHYTITGDIEECNGIYKEKISDLWNKLSYTRLEDESLIKNKYDFFSQNDFYNKLIKQVESSDIIIVNHSVLCSDLSNDTQVLPEDAILVIDEGHNLINSIQSNLTKVLSDSGFIKSLNIIKKLLVNSKIHDREILDDVNDILDKLIESSAEIFNLFKFNFEDTYLKLKYGSKDILLSNEEFRLNGLDFSEIYSLLTKLQNLFEVIQNDNRQLMQLQLAMYQLSDLKYISEVFYKNKANYIKWVSIYKYNNRNNFKLYISNSDIREFILDKICKTYPSFLMCSATFTINNSFEFFFNKYQISKSDFSNLNTKTYESPFFYEDQSKFFIYNKSIDINSSDYINDVSNQISSVCKTLCKRTLVLCTSYKQVRAISNNLKNNFNLNDDNLFIQTSKHSKKKLLDNFKSSTAGILIATSTFWEGVDLKGDLLEVLFIIRIPFVNPSNPYSYHLSNKIESQGGNSFYDLQLPNAILKLKQGVGRLIRSDKDSGICIMTDTRLSNSRYGKFIVDELTDEPEFYSNIEEIINKADNFLG